jgi:hypothetical protein
MSSSSVVFVLWLSVGLLALAAGMLTIGWSTRGRQEELRDRKGLDGRSPDILSR